MNITEEIRAALVAAGIEPDGPANAAPAATPAQPVQTTPTDFRTASADELAAEMAKYRLRPRQH